MLLAQQRIPDDPQADQPESNDERTTDALDPYLVVVQCAAKRGRAGAQQNEHQREAADKEYGVDQSNAAALLYLRQCHPGKKSQIAGYQRKHAGGQEAQEPSEKSNQQSQGGRLVHSGPSSRCRHERHTP